MEDAYILESVRSPIGKFMGRLSEFTATALGAEVVKGLVSKSKIDAVPDGIIVGNVLSAGLGQNPAKQVLVYSGLKNTVPTLNVNMVCASGLKAVSLAAESMQAGNSDIVIAGGIESMTNSPHTVKGVRQFRKFGNSKLKELYDFANSNGSVDSYDLVDEMLYTGLWDCYSDMHMGTIAEKIGEKDGITREGQDKFAVESHRRAAYATDNGKFKDEIIPIKLKSGEVFSQDEGIRRDTSVEKLAALKPAFKEGGTVTAGNASQLSDGAAFSIVVSGKKAKELGLKPIAKIESYADSGIDPGWYGLSPIDSISKALSKAGRNMEDIDLFEINEAFCVQVLGVAKEMGISTDKLNVNGGATALGHPIGASGARLLATLVHAMRDRKKNVGVVSLCHGGGGSASMVISRID